YRAVLGRAVQNAVLLVQRSRRPGTAHVRDDGVRWMWLPPRRQLVAEVQEEFGVLGRVTVLRDGHEHPPTPVAPEQRRVTGADVLEQRGDATPLRWELGGHEKIDALRRLGLWHHVGLALPCEHERVRQVVLGLEHRRRWFGAA